MIEVLGLVTARGGSKGLPRKALAELGGQPLIAWTIDAAKRARFVTRLVTSTDDPEIADAARQLGSEVPFLRPADLATDTSPHILGVEHALDWLHIDHAYMPRFVVTLQPTNPLRSADDIDRAIEIAIQATADAVIGVSETPAHPLLAKRLRADGILEDFISGARPAYVRRQDREPVYIPNGAIYVNSRTSLLEGRSFVPTGSHAYVMPPDRSIDIDTPYDLEIARCLVAARRTRD